MRFNKGSKVEVLSRREVPSGSWHRAEIISGNGRNYMIKYEGMAGTTNKTVVERVPRKAIRPCPPPHGVSENWIPGDIVEVFDNNSWKMAIVSKVLGKKYFLIRLLGSSQEFKVSKSHLRLRQYYQDDRWVMIGKVSGNCEEKDDENLNMKYNHNSSSQIQLTNKRMDALVRDDYSFVRSKGDLQESRIVSSQTLKRGSPNCYSPEEACAGASQKFRVTEEEGRRRRLVATYPSLFPEQVDAVASPRQMLREKYMHDRINGFSEMDAERWKPNDAIRCSLAIKLDSNDADSDKCSVGSCSIGSNNSHKLSHHFSVGPVEDTDGHLSDAESICRLGYEEGNYLLPTKEELAAEIHRLELHAYRCTIEALHASGPLSWEQEALVTNLRLSLHISNDEHLMELRNLVSSETSIPVN